MASTMTLAAYAEKRTLSDLRWLTAERIQEALRSFRVRLTDLAKGDGPLARYCRCALPISSLWADDPDMLWLDPENPGYLEFDDRLRLAVNPTRIVPFWTSRPPAWGELRGDALKTAFLAYTVGLVHHDVTHVLVWIAYQKLPGFHTIWLGEELNCTLWGTTIAYIGVTGRAPDLSDPATLDMLVESAQPPIFAVHVRDYLIDRDQVLQPGPTLESAFSKNRRAKELMKAATELVPEHPAAERAYRRFAEWTAANRNDPLDGGAILHWRVAR